MGQDGLQISAWNIIHKPGGIRTTQYTIHGPGLRNVEYPLETHLYPKSLETSLAHILLLIYTFFCNFVQITTVSRPCFVQNVRTIGQLKQMLRTNDISRDLSLNTFQWMAYTARQLRAKKRDLMRPDYDHEPKKAHANNHICSTRCCFVGTDRHWSYSQGEASPKTGQMAWIRIQLEYRYHYMARLCTN